MQSARFNASIKCSLSSYTR